MTTHDLTTCVHIFEFEVILKHYGVEVRPEDREEYFTTTFVSTFKLRSEAEAEAEYACREWLMNLHKTLAETLTNPDFEACVREAIYCHMDDDERLIKAGNRGGLLVKKVRI